MSRSIRSSASTLASARPSWLASSGASTWTQTMSWSSSASIAVAALGGVVGVEVAGRARHVDPVPAGEHADAADQVDGRDDRPLQAVQLGELRQLRGLPLSPEPDRVGRRLARREPGLVDGMVRHDLGPRAHQLAEQLGAGAPGQVVGGGLVGHVVRRGGQRVVAERRLAGPAAVDQQVAIADAGVELDAGAAEPAPGSAADQRRALPRS